MHSKHYRRPRYRRAKVAREFAEPDFVVLTRQMNVRIKIRKKYVPTEYDDITRRSHNSRRKVGRETVRRREAFEEGPYGSPGE